MLFGRGIISFSIKINNRTLSVDTGGTSLAHEVLVVTLVIMGVILLLGYILGPSREVRRVKRIEAQAMLIPTAVLLFVLAAILFSGVLDVGP